MSLHLETDYTLSSLGLEPGYCPPSLKTTKAARSSPMRVQIRGFRIIRRLQDDVTEGVLIKSVGDNM